MALSILAGVHSGHAQGTAFTYQGRLDNGTSTATGSYDLTFSVFDADTAGNQVGVTLTNTAVGVSNGLFTVTLDFGAGVFDGTARWLEIGVATNGDSNFATLSPRQPVTPTPYAIYSANAASAAAVATGVIAPDQLATPAPPVDGQVLAFTGGSLQWTDPAVAGGSVWSLNGSSAFYNAGNVGIGTASPLEKLTIAGVTSYNTGLKLTGSALGGTGLSLENTSSGGRKFDLLSGGSSDGIGAGAFGLFDDTTGTYCLYTTPADDVGIGKNLNFGSTARQMMNLFGTGFGIGIQTADMYFRSGGGFAWHVGGTHANGTYDSGGGTTVATLDLTTGLDFGSRLGQQLTLWGGVSARRFAIGVQDSTLYSRCGNGAADGFVWYKGGVFDSRYHNGGGGQILMTVDANGLFAAGPASVCTLTIRGGCDLAEPFTMKEAEIEKGSVVVIDEEHPGQLKLSTEAYDTRVAGIVSGANGINPGIALHQEGSMEGGQNVALTGRVYVKADAGFGAIKAGDMLTTSETPGCAMKVSDHAKAQGAILGKAMSSLKEGKGMVLVLVTLQ
jgi:hypothetical protein